MARLSMRWLAAMLALTFVLGAGIAARAASGGDGHARSPPDIVGWRLPTAIVLSGAIVGAHQLRDAALAHGNGPKAFDPGDSAEDEGEPTPLMRLLVSALSEMNFGRIELKGGRLTVVGIADANRVEGLKTRFATSIPREVQIAPVLIDAPENAPFHWSAVAGDNESLDADALTLSGDVADEVSRGRLVTAAKSIAGDKAVVDAMHVRPSVASEVAANALLAQMRIISNGFVWIYGRKFDLIGISSKVETLNDGSGCRALTNIVPKGLKCGIVQIAFHQRYHYYRPHYYRRSYNGHNRSGPRRHPVARYEEEPPPPPRYVAERPTEPPADLVDKAVDRSVVDILFATLRQRKEEDASPGFVAYSGERGENLAFGRARVRVPEGHEVGRLELPGGFSVLGLQITRDEPDPKKHFTLRSAQALTQAEWDALIDKIGPHEAVIFVHGFNTSFKDAVFRFAQITYDLRYKGLPVLFSWASRGDVTDYEYDRNSALVARDGFRQLLDNLSQKHGISKVNVIAHSMGNFLVLDALANATSPTGPMGQLIMAAPDVDLNQFVQTIPKVTKFFSGLTLYASSTDRALALSMKLAGGVSRAGYVPEEGPVVLQGMETLDVSALGQEMFGLNHGTFAEARPLIDDIGLILAKGEHAPRLPEELPVPDNASTPKYWRFAR